jgi:two-component system, NarL family, sensor histidine kinase DesK
MPLLPDDLPFSKWLPFSWLVYLSIFVVYTVLSRSMHSPAWWTLSALAIIVFLFLYFRGYWLEGRRLVPIVVAITAIGVAFIRWNPGASVFFVYAAAFAANLGSATVAAAWIAGIMGAAGVTALALHLPPEAWLPAILLPVIIGGGNIAFAEKRRANGRLRLAQEEVEHLAKIAERERIARDLHDLLGHTLSIIVLKSELAAKLADRDPGRAVSEIRDVERISRDALGEVRRAVQGYRHLTLGESIARARQALAAAGVRLDVESAPGHLAPKIEGVVSLVIREAVTNVIRHAKATTCRVTMRELEGELELVVQDDGIGGIPTPGSGLSGMRARVEEVGGRFEHDGRAGTALTVRVPVTTGECAVARGPRLA